MLMPMLAFNWSLLKVKMCLNSAGFSSGAPEGQQQEGRSGGQWENQFGEYPAQRAFIPAVPCPLHPGRPHPSAGLSEPQQAAFWEPLLPLRLKRLVYFSERNTYHCWKVSSNKTAEITDFIYNSCVSEFSPCRWGRRGVLRWPAA